MPGVDAPVRPVEVQQIDDALVRAFADLPERLDLLTGAGACRAVAAGRVPAAADPAAWAGDTLAGPSGDRGGNDRASREPSTLALPRWSRQEPAPGATSIVVVMAGTRQSWQRPSTTPVA